MKSQKHNGMPLPGIMKANSGKIVVIALLFVIFSNPLFAQETIDTLDEWSEKILDLFTSPWVKALLLIALIVEAIALVVAGQQGGGGQMLKRFGPWIIGTIILLSASSICGYFLGGLEFEVQ